MTIPATTQRTSYRMRTGADALAAAVHGLAGWLRLAAMPTYTFMALFIAVFGESPKDMFCMAMHASPLSGMVVMYMLMSVFHSAPWLKLVAGPRGGV
jgi:hypothetical protein